MKLRQIFNVAATDKRHNAIYRSKLDGSEMETIVAPTLALTNIHPLRAAGDECSFNSWT